MNPSSRRSVWTTGLGTTLAWGNWGALPFVIGSLIEATGIRPEAAALLGTVELSTMGVTMLLLTPFMPTLSRRWLGAIAVPTLIATQLFIVNVQNYYQIMASLAVGGVAAGIICAVATAEGAGSGDSDRTFALSTVIVMICGVAKSLLLGFSKQHYGYRGIFLLMFGFCTVVGIPLLVLLLSAPASATHGQRDRALAGRPVLSTAVGVLVTMCMFSLSTSGVYAFIERVADHVSINAATLGRCFAMAGVVGTLGGVAASRVGLKFGRPLPTAGSFLLLGVLSFAVMHSPQPMTFFILYPCWVIVHWFCYSYVMGLSVLVDAAGRLATLTSATYILAGAAGAGLAGLITGIGGVAAYGVVALGICVVGAIVSYGVLLLHKAKSEPATV